MGKDEPKKPNPPKTHKERVETGKKLSTAHTLAALAKQKQESDARKAWQDKKKK